MGVRARDGETLLFERAALETGVRNDVRMMSEGVM